MSIWTELALSYQKELNRRYDEVNKAFASNLFAGKTYGTAPTLLGKRADMLICDDVAAEVQRIKEDAMPERPSKMYHCHLCFSPKLAFDCWERHETDKIHVIDQTVEFTCGTKVSNHMVERHEDGEWSETENTTAVAKGERCI